MPDAFIPRRPRRLQALALATLMGAGSASAWAADPAPRARPAAKPTAAPAAEMNEARRHFRQGMIFFEDRDYNGALAEFETAYRISREPIALYQMGVTLRSLFRYQEAIETLERYLTHTSMDARVTPDQRRTVERYVAEMKALLARISLSVTPKDAVVLVDGRAPKLDGDGLWLAAGDHVLEVSAPDHTPSRQELRVVAGVPQAVKVDLAPISRYGKVSVTSDQAETRLRLDGADRGATPQEFQLLAGGHQLEARAPGFRTWQSELNVAANQTRRIDIQMEREVEATPSIFKRWWFWTGAAVVVGAVATGVVLSTGSAPRQSPLIGTLSPGSQSASP